MQQLEAKIDRTVQDLADGIINRAQFENLYRHYQNQRRTLLGLLAEGSGQVPESLTTGESMIIRQKYAAKVLAYAVYDNESSVPLHTMGNFPVDSDLVVGFLSGFRSAAAEILGAGASRPRPKTAKCCVTCRASIVPSSCYTRLTQPKLTCKAYARLTFTLRPLTKAC